MQIVPFFNDLMTNYFNVVKTRFGLTREAPRDLFSEEADYAKAQCVVKNLESHVRPWRNFGLQQRLITMSFRTVHALKSLLMTRKNMHWQSLVNIFI